ncbi:MULTISPECIES: hypothetical protein [Frankia]|uniref:hypothetical protein n=1 Tax=Frankia TaxID=1854 RepID=UPI0005D10ECE|nr:MULTISPECIES: hypothetical protein [Frankia]KQC37143.1 hypothetical protein UK82_16970 [Frankia sp. ACN1ag]
MRRPFAHEFVLVLAPGGDERAPGAAITAALCGRWEHPPPCPQATCPASPPPLRYRARGGGS